MLCLDVACLGLNRPFLLSLMVFFSAWFGLWVPSTDLSIVSFFTDSWWGAGRCLISKYMYSIGSFDSDL